METSKIVYTGDLRTEATHLRSGTVITTDAPLDNNGRGEYFSPTDLTATSLGSCMITIMGIAARNQGFDIDGTTIAITKVMADNPRRIGEVHIEYQFPDIQYSEKEKKIIEAAGRTCPVAMSLGPEVKQVINYHFRI